MLRRWLAQLQRATQGPRISHTLLSKAHLAQVQEGIKRSPFLAPNVLNERFSTTQGFSIIFKASESQQVAKYFEYMTPYLNQVVKPEFNLYYLNALVLEKSAKVDRHIDHSIRGYNPDLPFPKQVSVFYVDIPDMSGGELLLYDTQDQVQHRITPQTNAFLRFPGHLKHGIEAIEDLPPKTARISLVCEQYRLNRSQLAYVPDFTIKSTANFAAFLAQESP